MQLVDIELEEENLEQIQRKIILGQQQYSQLNIEQKAMVDYVLSLLITNNFDDARCLYIDGPGGKGKTFIYTKLYYLLQSLEKIVSTMAFTGIAATLLPNGKTVHKTLGLPVPLYDDSNSNIKAQSKEADIFTKN